MTGRGRIVSHQAQPRRIAIGDPQVEVAVQVPVDHRDRSSVAGVIQTGRCGNVGELAVGKWRHAGIQKAAIPLVTAE